MVPKQRCWMAEWERQAAAVGAGAMGADNGTRAPLGRGGGGQGGILVKILIPRIICYTRIND